MFNNLVAKICKGNVKTGRVLGRGQYYMGMRKYIVKSQIAKLSGLVAIIATVVKALAM